MCTSIVRAWRPRVQRSERITFQVPARLDYDALPADVRDAGHWFLDVLHRRNLQWRFDLRRALQIVGTLEPDDGCRLTTAQYRAIVREQCIRMAERDRYITADAYGRVHTPITSLPKALRQCLSIAGRPLVGIDIANSQPLFAGVVARADCTAGDRQRRAIATRRYDGRRPVRYDTQRMARGAQRTREDDAPP